MAIQSLVSLANSMNQTAQQQVPFIPNNGNPNTVYNSPVPPAQATAGGMYWMPQNYAPQRPVSPAMSYIYSLLNRMYSPPQPVQMPAPAPAQPAPTTPATTPMPVTMPTGQQPVTPMPVQQEAPMPTLPSVPGTDAPILPTGPRYYTDTTINRRML